METSEVKQRRELPPAQAARSNGVTKNNIQLFRTDRLHGVVQWIAVIAFDSMAIMLEGRGSEGRSLDCIQSLVVGRAQHRHISVIRKHVPETSVAQFTQYHLKTPPNFVLNVAIQDLLTNLIRIYIRCNFQAVFDIDQFCCHVGIQTEFQQPLWTIQKHQSNEQRFLRARNDFSTAYDQ